MTEKIEHFPTILPGPRKERGVKTKGVDLKKVALGGVAVAGAAAGVGLAASQIKEQQQTPELPAEALFLAFHPDQKDQLVSVNLGEEARIQIAGTNKGAEDILKEIDKVAPADEIGRSFGIFTPEEMSGLLGSLPGGAKLESLRILTLTTEDGEKTQFLFAQTAQGDLEAVPEPGFVGWAKPVTQSDNELWSLVWNTDKGEWAWVFYGGSGDNFGKPGSVEVPGAAPTESLAKPTEAATSTPTGEPAPKETPTKTAPPPPPPTETATETRVPTKTATPKPTETATPVPTPEAPFFIERTEEGRKNGIFRFYTPDGKTQQRINDPENSEYSKYDGGIHWMYVHLPGYERVLVRGARVIEKNEQTRVLTLRVGDGTVQRKFTNKTISCLYPHIHIKGVTVDKETKCGGNFSDLEEGDLISLWAPETPAGHDNLASPGLVDAFGVYAVQ